MRVESVENTIAPASPDTSTDAPSDARLRAEGATSTLNAAPTGMGARDSLTMAQRARAASYQRPTSFGLLGESPGAAGFLACSTCVTSRCASGFPLRRASSRYVLSPTMLDGAANHRNAVAPPEMTARS